LIILYCVSIVILVLQDWRTRKVDLIWLLLFGGLQISTCIVHWSETLVYSSITNLLMLVILLSVIYLYAKWRGISFGNAWGIGDTVFLFIMALGMDSPFYIQTIIISCVVAIIAYYIRLIEKSKHIPFISFLGVSLLINLFIQGEGLWVP